MARVETIRLKNGEEIKLTLKEKLFCEYYIGECQMNGRQAAMKAGYSKKTAAEIANQNLNKIHITKFIKDQTAPLYEAMGITKERILRERSALAFTNLTDFVDDNWNLKPKSAIDPKFYPALNQISIKERVLMQDKDNPESGIVLSREITFKTADKDRSLSALENMLELTKEPEPKSVTVNIHQNILHQYSQK